MAPSALAVAHRAIGAGVELRAMPAPFVEELQCSIVRLEYDFTSHTARLFLPDLSCTDMSGAIAFCQRLDEAVRRIETFEGERPDIQYQLLNGKWHARESSASR